jgi:hypothetical protein
MRSKPHFVLFIIHQGFARLHHSFFIILTERTMKENSLRSKHTTLRAPHDGLMKTVSFEVVVFDCLPFAIY